MMASRFCSLFNRASPIVAFGIAGTFIGWNSIDRDHLRVFAAHSVNAGNLNWTDTSFIFDDIQSGYERTVEQNGKVFFQYAHYIYICF